MTGLGEARKRSPYHSVHRQIGGSLKHVEKVKARHERRISPTQLAKNAEVDEKAAEYEGCLYDILEGKFLLAGHENID